MSNPFDSRRQAPRTASASLREWCHEQNLHPLSERMDRWYYVRERDGIELIDSLDGTDGGNVRRELDGRLPPFQGWPENRMTGYRRWLRTVAAKGLRDGALEQAA